MRVAVLLILRFNTSQGECPQRFFTTRDQCNLDKACPDCSGHSLQFCDKRFACKKLGDDHVVAIGEVCRRHSDCKLEGSPASVRGGIPSANRHWPIMSDPSGRTTSATIRTEVADAADETVAWRLLDQYEPEILVLVAGANPVMRPLQHHTWDAFSVNWHTDVKIAFTWLREALLKPLPPGSRIVVVSSGAAINGSPAQIRRPSHRVICSRPPGCRVWREHRAVAGVTEIGRPHSPEWTVSERLAFPTSAFPQPLDVAITMYSPLSNTPGHPCPHPSRQAAVRFFGVAVGLLALVGAAAACSGASQSAATTEAATTTTTKATTTTEESTTTTTDAATTTTTTEAATTTTVPAEPIYPLTGLENPDPVLAARPALIVKIDNASGARPQSGFNEADLVFEEIVNDHITRFAMVFQSGDSDPVGPIRSGRLQDVALFTALDHPLFAWSGGNATVTNEINNSELVNIGPSRAAVYHRATDRKIPHNLYSNTAALYTQTRPFAPPAKQQFAYREPGAPAAGTPSAGVAVKLDSIDVGWDWNAKDGVYYRTMEGRRHIDRNSGQVSTNNVVVLAMEYAPGISGSPDAQTLGKGEVFVFTGGNYIHGTWTRNDIHDPFALVADDGKIIQLQPGRSFIELPRQNSTLPLGPA